MKLDLNKTITIRELIECAKFLKDEDGINDEYDRALLELVTDAARIPQNDRTIIAKLIGVDDYIHPRN